MGACFCSTWLPGPGMLLGYGFDTAFLKRRSTTDVKGILFSNFAVTSDQPVSCPICLALVGWKGSGLDEELAALSLCQGICTRST